ncbi:hypothetical protein LR48_Vigan07g119000 [Vigna angularis]|uniref:Uncharacterized protein n=1 Tax=Phaseolus angularis TaxID=3914 RepID=A0A0L9UXQ5_PHAAN|nr:hypothetical protein LR48_Vigan07g119000 [Vigna angularis]
MQVSISNHKSIEAAIRSLEIQVGQLAKKLEDKSERNFGANTEVNPKEECNAIMIINGEMLVEREIERKEKKVGEKEKMSGEKNEERKEELDLHASCPLCRLRLEEEAAQEEEDEGDDVVREIRREPRGA